MKEVTGNLWTYRADYRVITTNGTLRKDGCAVMGRGCAAEAAERYPMLPKELGDKLKQHGNVPIWFPRYYLFTFPVKHHWQERADLTLIEHSAKELLRFLDPRTRYVLPRPGCGNGGRTWDEVKPLLLTLPDNVHVIHWPNYHDGEDDAV